MGTYHARRRRKLRASAASRSYPCHPWPVPPAIAGESMTRMQAPFSHAEGSITDPPAIAGGTDFLFAVALDAETFDHPVERASIDAENLGGARSITAGDFEHVKQITPFHLVD